MTSEVEPRPAAPDTLERVVGVALFFGILVFYLAQLPAFAVPGRWADMLTAFSGLDPVRPVIRPLWSGLMVGLAALPIPQLALAANLCSALIGAAACALLYGILRRVPFGRTKGWRQRSAQERMPRLLAGVVAALYAAVLSPTLIASTRGDFAAFGVFLFLLACYPSFLYLQRPRVAHLYLTGLFLGLALVEYPAMLLMLPLLALWWLVLVWTGGQRHWMHLLAAFLLATVLAFALATLYAQAYAASAAAAWQGGVTTGGALHELARNHLLEMTRCVPKVGWLLIFCTSVVPFLAILFREHDEPRDVYSAIGIYSLRLILLALAVITLFNLPGAPLRVTGARVLLIAPGFIVATWFGFLAGYYLRLLERFARAWPRVMLVVVLAALLGAAAYRHTASTSARNVRPVADAADELVRQLDGRAWIVTDGTLDSSLRLAARKAGRTLHVLMGEARPASALSRYHASLFTNAALQSAAMVGLRPLIHEWVRQDRSITGQVASLVAPEWWGAEGLVLTPSRLSFRLEAAGRAPAAEELFRVHEAFWKGLRLPELTQMDREDAGWLQSFFLVRWTSRLANDVGVQLDHQGQPELARQAYRRALSIWPDNMSAG